MADFAFFDLAPVPYFLIDSEGVISRVNKKGAELLGLKHYDLLNKVFAQFILKQDTEKLKLCRVNLIENRNSQSCEARMFKSDGSIIFVRLDMAISRLLGGDFILMVLTDISYQRQILDTQQFLLGNIWSDQGRDFFEVLAEYLSTTLKVDYVCIDKLHENDAAETVAVYYDGHFEDNVRYTLKDTPCGKVVGTPVCSFPRNVRNLFPYDKVLQDMSAESYVGITLWGTNEKPIGLIAVISKKPVENTNLIETVLKQVSIRAAAELEHRSLINKMNRIYTALEKSSLAALTANDEEHLLNQVCQIIIKDCGFSLVWIGFANEDEEQSVSVAASAGFDEGYLNSLNLTWQDTERGRGPTGTTIRTGKITICRNMRTDPRFAPWREEALRRGYQSSICFPLKSNERTFGSVAIYSPEPDPFKDDEIRLLTKLTNDLAQGITAIRLRKANQIAEETLSSLYK